MTQKTLAGTAGDFIVHMESLQKCLTYGHLTMPASGGAHTLANVTAYPLKANNVLAIAGEEASVVAFVIAGEPITAKADGTATSGVPYYTILNKSDGIVLNKDAIPTADCQATPGTFNVATIVTTLTALGWKFVEEPDNQTTQTS